MKIRASKDRRHSRLTDGTLRLVGLCALAIAGGALGILMRMQEAAPNIPPGVFAYLLAALGFLGVTCGCGLLMLGHHIFDEVEVSERWRPKAPNRVGSKSALSQQPDLTVANAQEHDHELVPSLHI